MPELGKLSTGNQAYARKLRRKLEGLPWKVLLSVSAEMYKTALQSTYQDTGQFAYNWQFLVGAEKPSPARTDMRGTRKTPGVAPVGRRGDARGYGHPAVIRENLKRYNLNSRAFGARTSPLMTYLSGSRYRSVTLMNPLASSKYGQYPTRADMANVDADVRITYSWAVERAMDMVLRGVL